METWYADGFENALKNKEDLIEWIIDYYIEFEYELGYESRNILKYGEIIVDISDVENELNINIKKKGNVIFNYSSLIVSREELSINLDRFLGDLNAVLKGM